MAEILFHGAAQEVTGSMHLLHLDGQWVALDCGLYQGKRAEAEEKNRQWPMPPEQIAAVVLSHAHTDHSGRLPLLVKQGFTGPIFATPATRDLCAIMLPDSAHVQEEDVYYVSKRRKRNGLPPIEPLYDYDDALAAVKQIQSVSYDRFFPVVPGLMACFQEAGHMLGAGGIRLALAKRNGHTPSLFYSGDVGRPGQPIIRDPAPLPEDDTILCESTYGGRLNEAVDDAKTVLREVVARTLARGGKLIIPSFAVGRTQTIVYFLHEEMVAGTIPRIPVYVDSPLAVNATEVFKLHPECYDAEARAFYRVTGDILGSACCTYIRNLEESKALHDRAEPCIIISASGMCEAGRIRHHIKNNITNPKNTILIAGYQAMNTLGRRIAEGAKVITLFHEDYPVKAEVVEIHGFSGHADQADLMHWLGPQAAQAKRLVLVHGEPDQTAALAEKAQALGFHEVVIGQRGQHLEL
jgi:metallo-beta-lactamase family protein